MSSDQDKVGTPGDSALSSSSSQERIDGEYDASVESPAVIPNSPRVSPSAAARGAFYFPPRRPRSGRASGRTTGSETPSNVSSDVQVPEDADDEAGSLAAPATGEREEGAADGTETAPQGATASEEQRAQPAETWSLPDQGEDVQDDEDSVERLLMTLVQVSRLTMALLEAGDPNPEELETLAARRAEVFARLQRAVERERQQRQRPMTPEEKARRAAIAGELQQVDGQCVQLGKERLAESKSDWEKTRLLRRTLIAYGWNDPEYAPRGYFVDTVD